MIEKNNKKHRTESEKQAFIRKHRQTFMLNDLEFQALNKFLKKYKLGNRAKFLRETVMSAVIKKFEEDYPRLFADESDDKS
jgi:hypothetical protein